MSRFQPRDPSWADRVGAAFNNGCFAPYWGGELASVSPGTAEITVSFRDVATGGPGMLHRSMVAAFLDDACVLAALSLSSAGDAIATAEYKLNFLAPAKGESICARAQVVRPGRNITVCKADALVDDVLIAKMLATLAVSRPG